MNNVKKGYNLAYAAVQQYYEHESASDVLKAMRTFIKGVEGADGCIIAVDICWNQDSTWSGTVTWESDPFRPVAGKAAT